MLEASVLTALSVLLSFVYFDIRKVAGYAFFVDTASAVILGWLFIGTYSGAMTGLVSGLWITLALMGVKYFLGYAKLEWNRLPGESVPRLRWIYYPPTRKHHAEA
jgi:predicted membrane protein